MKIRVLRVDPRSTPKIVEVENELKSLQEQVGGYIECVYPFDDNVAIICNEEGKINGMTLNRALYGEDGNAYDIIAGQFLVVGLAGEEFDSLPEAMINKYYDRFRKPEIFLMINGKLVII